MGKVRPPVAAVITQHFSVTKCSEAKLLSTDFGAHLTILSVEKGFRHLCVGQLSSNSFCIQIQTDSKYPDPLPQVARFYNYFGLQRFGVKHHQILTNSPEENIDYVRKSTAGIGVLLLLGKFADAANVLFTPSCEGKDESSNVLRHICDGLQDIPQSGWPKETCFAKWLKKLHPARKTEIALLKGMRAFPGKWNLAWKSIPFRLRQFIVQSGTSLLWNRLVSNNDHTALDDLPFIGGKEFL